jgi:hypothetical protein
MDYETLFERYQSLSWVDSPFPSLTVRLKLDRLFGDKMRAELDATHKRHFPRRKRINHYDLPEDITTTALKKWQDRGVAYFKCALGRRAWLKKKLDSMAQDTTIEPLSEKQCLHVSRSSTYRSQGYGATKYAKVGAERYARPVKDAGIDVEIRKVNEHTGKQYSIYYADFEVWAALEPWQVDAISRRDRGNLLDWAVKCWRSGANPKVYNPFLPWDIFEKSQAIAMGVADD